MKRYSEEFKREAVELLRTNGRPLAQVARELGVSAESLRLWRKQAEMDAGEREGLSSEEHEEPRRLHHERHMVKRTRIGVSLGVAVVAVAAAVVFLLVPLAGCGGDDDDPVAENAEKGSQAAAPVEGSFVGEVAGRSVFIAVVAAPPAGNSDRREVEVYVADGSSLSQSLSGSISDNSFVATSEEGDVEVKGKLRNDSVSGTVELPGGETAAYRANRPTGAAGLYDLSVSPKGKLRGASTGGLGLRGTIKLAEGTGTLRLADGRRLRFEMEESSGSELIRLPANQVRLIVLPDGELRGAGKAPPSGDTSGFFIRVG